MKGLFGRLLHHDESLGDRGERYAAKWLARRGYRILHRKLRIGRDEADLVAVAPDAKTVVIVEVKTRSAPDPPPEAAFTADKQHKMFRLAVRLRNSSEFADRPMRFDAVVVVWPHGETPELHHYEGAFETPF